MLYRLIILIAIVYFLVKYIEKRKLKETARPKTIRKKSEVRLLLSRLRRIEQFVDPTTEGDKIKNLLKSLAEAEKKNIDSTAFKESIDILNSIIGTREADVKKTSKT